MESREDRKVIGSLGLEPCYPATGLMKGRRGGDRLCAQPGLLGRGPMPEAVEAVIDYCFRELNWDYLTCGHYNRNDRSRRVIEKCGFRYDRDFAFQTRLGTVEPGKCMCSTTPEGGSHDSLGERRLRHWEDQRLQ